MNWTHTFTVSVTALEVVECLRTLAWIAVAFLAVAYLAHVWPPPPGLKTEGVAVNA